MRGSYVLQSLPRAPNAHARQEDLVTSPATLETRNGQRGVHACRVTSSGASLAFRRDLQRAGGSKDGTLDRDGYIIRYLPFAGDDSSAIKQHNTHRPHITTHLTTVQTDSQARQQPDYASNFARTGAS